MENKKSYEELPWDYMEGKESSLKRACPSADLAGVCVMAVYVTANFLLNHIHISEVLG